MDGYSTYDTPKSENSHGMIILVHKDIPSSELATQFKFGHHTESLSIRKWVNGSNYILHNIYNNGNTVNFSAAPSNEKSLFLGDFNAHHTSWCRAAQNRAGINISEQLDDMDQYVMMNMENEEYIPTTTYNTTIDLAIIHCDIAAKANWDIYESFASDHFAIIISWYPGPPIERTLPLPKFQMNKADWPKFQEVINTKLIGFQSSDDIDDYNQLLLHMLTNAAEQSIPKSTPRGAVKKYWRYELSGLSVLNKITTVLTDTIDEIELMPTKSQ